MTDSFGSLPKKEKSLNFADAYMKLAKRHGLNEEDMRRALIITIEHLNENSRRRQWKRLGSDAVELLDEWLTQGHEWVAPDFSNPRDAATWLLHRCTACTWAVLVAQSRIPVPESA